MNTYQSTFSRHLLARPYMLLLIAIFCLWLGPSNQLYAATAYIDPALTGTTADELSVIVTGVDVETAVSAINTIGGDITSELWLIDAAGATIPANQLNELAAYPGINSIVSNYQVNTTEGTDCEDKPDHWRCSEGFGTDRRRVLGSYESDSPLLTPAVNLPDGGTFSVAENGTFLILNNDYTLRVAGILPEGKPYKTNPVVDAGGNIYVAGEDKYVYSVSPDGAIRWTYEGSEKFKAGVTLGANNTVFVANDKGYIVTLDSATGAVVWEATAAKDDHMSAAMATAKDGTLYALSEEGNFAAINPFDGTILWSFFDESGKPFKLDVQVGPDGSIFIIGENKQIYVLNADGSLKYQLSTADKIKAQPIFGTDGSLYVATESPMLYGFNTDGSLRFVFDPEHSGHFESSPILSPDESQIYVSLREKYVFAVDTASGALLWEYKTDGDLKASPLVDQNGNIHLGAANGRYTILDSDGNTLFSERRFGNISQNMTLSADGKNVIFPTDKKMVEVVGLLPESWDGTPDVQATSDNMVYEFLAPVTIDVGVDLVQDSFLQNGQPITGEGIGIAVIDSGVYFDKTVKEILSGEVEKLFLGQVSFLGDGVCGSEGGNQFDSYCETNKDTSRDFYGHGSHVAGIIWNHFTDYDTNVGLGVAPNANILSVQVLGEDGTGTYEDVIEGIQFVVANKDAYNTPIRVMNLSLSGHATTPYFVDPLNRAVEAAWAEDIVVVVAAGNAGPGAQTITVPGNDPYVITVGAINTNRTPGYWEDDTIPSWSSTGPTLDGFVKPDVLAPGSNIVSFMYNDQENVNNSAYLVQQHPDYSETSSLFRMNGTSMATAVTSGVVALMLEAQPDLTPDQVKFRLMASAEPATSEEGELAYSPLVQGAGRIWAPDAVLSTEIPNEAANQGMDILADLAHPWHENDDPNPETNPDLSYHYQGPVETSYSEENQAYLFYVTNPVSGDEPIALGIANSDDLSWITFDSVVQDNITFNDELVFWQSTDAWAGGMRYWAGGMRYWAGGMRYWAGGMRYWAGGMRYWAGGMRYWAGGMRYWAGGMRYWAGGMRYWAGGMRYWAGNTNWVSGIDSESANASATTWIESP